MDERASIRQWAELNFRAASLGDPRRTQRLVLSATRIAARPGCTFPQVFDWNQLRAFYNLCDQESVHLASVQQPHWQRTRQAMRQQPLVLILHDTTELDFTTHTSLKGAGPIGDGGGSGFLQHNSLAVLPRPRQVLGLAYQQWQVRQPAPARERSPGRKRRDRESQLWAKGIAAPGAAPEGCCWVDVGDRGSDIYEAMVAARDQGHHFLFRLTQNRQVFAAAEQEELVGLRDYARSLPSRGQDVVEIPGRGGRAGRTATVRLAGAPVWVPAPTETPDRWRQPIVGAWVIRVWEADAPAGAQPLEWQLLCSLPTTTLAELKERRDWYGCRWLIEVYHDVAKNGCAEEGRRFETAGRMEACLALLSVVAVRVLQLRLAAENQPEAPAEQVATAEEIELVRRLTKQRGRVTVRGFVHGVAKLGGFLGRKGDGNPGVRTLWRGYQRLQDMLLGFQLHPNSPPDSG